MAPPIATIFDILAGLPAIWPEDVLPAIRDEVRASCQTLVVLDDDPTGTQTVYDVPVITQWDEDSFVSELAQDPECFYVLTNSRSLTPPDARRLALELAVNLQRAATATARAITVVSRSDSTLRGHFPLETDAVAEVLGPFDATLIFPYFEAGGRLTIDDIHYVEDGGTLIPAADTPFARDAAFGYRHSNLREWVEEKTAGRVRATDVHSITLNDLRSGGPTIVAARLLALRRDSVVIVNAAAPRDAEIFALATLIAEREGRRFLYRTAASFVSARLGLPPRALLSRADFSEPGQHGGLIVVGSYVPKTTSQLAALRSRRMLHAVELAIDALLDDVRRDERIRSATIDLAAALKRGMDAVLFTSRNVVTGADAAASLAIGRRISDSLIAVVRSLPVKPRFLIAKGGITSSDVATRGLDVRRAIVRGQIIPGVPVWQLGPESRWPGLDYIVFPGNVGGETALAEVVEKLHRPPSA